MTTVDVVSVLLAEAPQEKTGLWSPRGRFSGWVGWWVDSISTVSICFEPEGDRLKAEPAMAADLPAASSPKGETPFFEISGSKNKEKGTERRKFRLQSWKEH